MSNDLHDETCNNFLLCDNTTIQFEWASQIQQLHDDMSKRNMGPILLYYLVLALTVWKTIEHQPSPTFIQIKQMI